MHYPFKFHRALRMAALPLALCCLLVMLHSNSFSQEFIDTDTVYDCYPGSPLDGVPSLQLPPKERWRKIATPLFIVTQGPPYHMVHDLVIAPGQNQVITGKFDYGAVFHKDLEYERIHVYIYGTGMSAWQKVGVYTTNVDGKIYATIPQKDPGEYMIKMVVAGDLSTAYGFMTVLDPGRKAVVFDLDGTLTLNDFEAVKDYIGIGDASSFHYAVNLVNLYKLRGYQIIYLSARPYWLVRETRGWFNKKGYPDTTIHATLNNNDSFDSAKSEQYKTEYLLYLKNSVQVNLAAAYGNSAGDIGAYQSAGIPDSSIYIIGDLAGSEGTVPIYDNYYAHYNWLFPILECGH